MVNFESAIDFVLVNEGEEVSQNKNDSGGTTRYGISLRFLKSLEQDKLKKYGIFVEEVTDNEIINLSRQQAIKIYRGEFWDTAPFEKLQNQKLGNYIFDMCINHGIGQGIKIAQRACWAAYKDRTIVVDDGVLGKMSLAKINYAGFLLVPALAAERAGFCRLIAHERSRDEEFLNGWLNRCYRI